MKISKLITFILILFIWDYAYSEPPNRQSQSGTIDLFTEFSYDDSWEDFASKYGKVMDQYSNIFTGHTLAWNMLSHGDTIYFLKCYPNESVTEYSSVSIVSITGNKIQEKEILSQNFLNFDYFENSSLYLIEDSSNSKYLDIFLGVLGAHYTGGVRIIYSIDKDKILLKEYDYNFPNKAQKYFQLENELVINTSQVHYPDIEFKSERDILDHRTFEERYYKLSSGQIYKLKIVPNTSGVKAVIMAKGFNALRFF